MVGIRKTREAVRVLGTDWLGSLPAKNRQAVLGKIGEALADPDKMRALLTYTQAPTNRQMLANALMRGGQFNAAQYGGSAMVQPTGAQ